MIRASVVIPTYRRPELLARCLAALEVQDLEPSAFEVLVADDAASPETRRLVDTFASRAPMAVRYLAVAGPHGPAAARNVGWHSALGEFIAFMDDDCIPGPSWLAAGIAALADEG